METKTSALETRITATELARNLSDILSRARYQRESFIVERNGEVVARIAPPSGKAMTWGGFVKWWGEVPKPDPAFWDDVEEAHRLMNQPIEEPPSWDC
jgi:antitoxin (DNA-binding transcriptional repressor) of toxin-antitoxin stability system